MKKTRLITKRTNEITAMCRDGSTAVIGPPNLIPGLSFSFEERGAQHAWCDLDRGRFMLELFRRTRASGREPRCESFQEHSR